jgi:tetratricopeptide (TPR) repeat protein
MHRVLLMFGCLAVCGLSRALAQSSSDPGGADSYLDLINEQKEPAQKLVLLEDFIRRFPKHFGTVLVYTQLQQVHLYMRQFPKAIEAGEKLLETNPDDLEAAEGCLEAAEALGDKDLAAKWAGIVRQTALLLIQSPPPKENDPEVFDYWNKRVEQARQLLRSMDRTDTSQEYNLYTQALKSTDMRKRIALLDELAAKYPENPYKRDTQLLYYIAYRQLGEGEQALNAAERLLKLDPDREDVLLFVADYYFQHNADEPRVLRLSQHLLELMRKKDKPAALSNAEWEHQKAIVLGMAHWMTGSISMRQERWVEATRSLRAALPFARGNTVLTAAILGGLGWADYQLRNLNEAANEFGQCILLATRYQEYCAKNLEAVKAELSGGN